MFSGFKGTSSKSFVGSSGYQLLGIFWLNGAFFRSGYDRLKEIFEKNMETVKG